MLPVDMICKCVCVCA